MRRYIAAIKRETERCAASNAKSGFNDDDTSIAVSTAAAGANLGDQTDFSIFGGAK